MVRGEQQSEEKVVTPMKKLLVAYLYFIQGIYLNIPGAIILTYKLIPQYEILGYFSFALIPFSFKFISAPIIEKYTSAKYGRRKTWLIISLIFASILQLVATRYATEVYDQAKLAIIFFIIIFFISLEDICTDGLAIKQLRDSELVSYLQLVYQLIGGVVGNLIFIQITSKQFAEWLGFTQPIISAGQFIFGLSILTLISAIVIHFTYVETVTKQQQKGVQHTLLEVTQHYVHFINPKFTLCRQALTNLLIVHGLHYFASSYAVQLIKNGHISKQILTTVSNFSIIPVLLLTHLISKYFSGEDKAHKRIRIMVLFRLVIMASLFFFNVTNPIIAITGLVLLTLASNGQFFFTSSLVNRVTDSKFAGMYVTMMASSVNLGNNTAIHLELISRFGQNICIIFGFIYTCFVIGIFGKVQEWIKSGQEQKDIESQAQKQERLVEEKDKKSV